MDHRSGEHLEGVLVARSRPLEHTATMASLTALGTPAIAWSPPGGPTVLGADAAVSIDARGPDRFESVRREAVSAFDRIDYQGPAIARPRALGGGAFHGRSRLSAPWDGVSPTRFVIPRIQVVEAGETWLTVVGEDGEAVQSTLEAVDKQLVTHDGPQTDTVTLLDTGEALPGRASWTSAVEAVLERIHEGPLEKLVLASSRRVDLDAPTTPGTLLERLGDRYPACYRFAFAPANGPTFLGAPPERLVAQTGDRVQTEALAGSAPRGGTEAADERHRSTLVEREASGQEHGLVVDAIVDRLEPVLESLAVGDRSVRRLATVQHLHTPVTGTLATDGHVLELVERLHPTPAVGGVPRGAAMAAIDEIEPFDRGWYAAPFGWFDAAGDGEFAVAIRTALLEGTELRLFAGNGIVAGCDPDAEWEELELKFDALLEVLR